MFVILPPYSDIDECLEDVDICGETGSCRNTPGEYVCECLEGFVKGPGEYQIITNFVWPLYVRSGGTHISDIG